MATRNHNYTIDLDKPLSRQNMGLLLATGDSKGDVFNFDLTRSGKAEALSGTVTVAGYFIRNDTATVAMYGSYSGNRVSVTLPASCYIEDGYFTLAVRVTAGGAKTTIAVIDGYIRLTTTNTLIDPGAVVPTLDDVLNQIAEMEAVTAEGEATIAAIRADTDAVIENTNKATAATIAATVELAETAAPAITPTATGSMVSITDGADRPAVQVISHIEPVQEGEGDPSPDNVRPIRGWDAVTAQRTEKNLIPNNWEAGSLTIDANGCIKDSTNNTGVQRQKNIYLKPGTYTLSASGWEKAYPYFYGWDYKVNKNLSAVSGIAIPYTFTVKQDCLLALVAPAAYVNGDVGNIKYQLELGSAATAYEPYQGQTITADLPETVYGGTVDWGTGVLTVDRVATSIANLTVVKEITDYQTFVIYGFAHTLLQNDAVTIGDSSHFKGLDRDGISSNLDNYIWCSRNYPNQLRIKCTSCADMTADQFKAAYADAQIVYRISDPYTIQLTPRQLETLKGTNNVWSDTGSTDLTYIADTKLYIDRKIAAIAAATV